MFKYKLFFVTLIYLSIASNGCEKDYLNTTPTGSVDAGSAFATTKNATAAINGIYRAFVVRYLGSQGHSGHPAMMIILDHMGDDMIIGAYGYSGSTGIVYVIYGRSSLTNINLATIHNNLIMLNLIVKIKNRVIFRIF